MPDRSNTPTDFDTEDTGPISSALIDSVTATAGSVPLVTAHDIAAALVKLGGAGGNGPPPKRFLAVTAGEWTKILIGMTVMAAVAFGGWLLVVRDAVRDSVSGEQLHEVIEDHSSVPHPVSASKADVKQVQAEVKEVQKKVNAIDTTQQVMKTDVAHVRDKVDDIANDVRRIRRRQR
jgi:hypothetical protein